MSVLRHLFKSNTQAPQEYLIHVFTGEQSKSEDSFVKVTIISPGKEPFSVPLEKSNHVSGKRHLFEHDTEDVFRADYKLKELGEVSLVQVTHHPRHEKQRDWFLDWIAVEDVPAGKIFYFPCNKWLSTKQGDGRETRILLKHSTLEVSKLKRNQPIMLAAKGLPLITKTDWSALANLAAEDTIDKEEARKLLEKNAIKRSFHNWASNVKVDDVLCFYPPTLSDVKNVIKLSAIVGFRVRSCGATHSWTMLYPDSGQVLIDPRHLSPEEGDKRIDYNKEEGCVTVLCNVTTYEVKVDQLNNKYNFLFNTVLGGVTYGGIIGTGCHGVGKKCPAHPDKVEEIHIVNSKGVLQKYDKTNETLLKAVTTSMGLFGFTYKIKFKVEPRELIVKTVNSFKYKVGDTLLDAQKLKDVVEKNFSTEVFWFPFNQMSMTKGFFNVLAPNVMEEFFHKFSVDEFVKTWKAEEDELYVREINFEENEKPEKDWFYVCETIEHFLQEHLFKNLPNFLADHPQAIPVFSSFTHHSQKPFKLLHIQFGQPESVVQELPRAIHYRKFVHEGFRVYDLEFAFVVEENYKNIVAACQAVVDTVKEHAQRSNDHEKFPMSLALEMRFMSESQSLLCPAVVGKTAPGKDIKVAYIEVLAFGSPKTRPLWQEFAQTIAQKWMSADTKVKPLPHWGKASELNPTPEFVKYLWDNNGDNMTEFLKQLESSGADPQKTFYNDYLKAVFKQNES